MIIDIRGTNGSGKSYPVHQLLKNHDHQVMDLITPYEVIDLTIIPSLQTTIIGKYTTACGGADGVTKQDAITWALKHLYPNYKTVIVEGSIVASVYKRWRDLAVELGKPNYLFAFMQTPLEVCIQSVVSRRLAAGNAKQFDPEKTLVPRFEAIQRIYTRLWDEGGFLLDSWPREGACDELYRRCVENCAP